jgi:tetratricopeptide (TPR) repeat protein
MRKKLILIALATLVLGLCYSEIKAFELEIDDPNVKFQSKEYYQITVPKYIDLGFLDNAERDQKEAAKKYPSDIDIKLLYGDILYAKGNPRVEYDYYTDLIRQFPNEAKIYEKRSYSDLDLKNQKQYIADLLKADQLSPNNARVLGNIGLYYLENQNYKESEKYLLKAYEADKQMTSTINNIASLYYYKKNYSAALEWINLSLAINDQNSYSYRIRSYIYKKLGRDKESQEDLSKVKYEE